MAVHYMKLWNPFPSSMADLHFDAQPTGMRVYSLHLCGWAVACADTTLQLYRWVLRSELEMRWPTARYVTGSWECFSTRYSHLLFLYSSNAAITPLPPCCHCCCPSDCFKTLTTKKAQILFRYLYGGYFYVFGVHLKWVMDSDCPSAWRSNVKPVVLQRL